MSLSRISPSGDGISRAAAFGSKNTTNVSAEWLRGSEFTTRFRNAAGAPARDADVALGWSWVIRQSQHGLSQEGPETHLGS